MSEQQYQKEVMDELKMLAYEKLLVEKVKEAYIEGWKQGMSDAKDVKYAD